MSRLAVPLLYRTLFASGDVLLRAEVDLLIKDDRGVWHQETFRVDSGAEMTTMFAPLAKQLGVPTPQHAVPNAVHAQTGLEIRSGVLRVQVVGMDATEYAFPCFFLGDPSGPPATPISPPAVPRTLLGLSGVINQLRITFDGDAGPGAPYGHLIVEKK
jgi:hypothetical protein